jgi:putative cardiolipin synthase
MADLLRLFAVWLPAYRVYAGVATSFLVAMVAGAWMRATLLMVAVALGGCAALPGHVERPVSYAQAGDATTPLAHVVAASTLGDAGVVSGFRLLPDGEEAFQTRLALIRKAERTLDVQYYQIANDRTGLEFLGALRDAASRGVRVRVLVDDLYASGEDSLFAEMGAVPNLGVRMFNPLPVRGDRLDARIVLSLHQFSRINHRMHNKLFIADGSLAVIGGRNIADEYFGRGQRANFIDADALVCGPVIGRLAAVFDSFWNSEHAYPIQALAPSAVTSPANAALDSANTPSSAAQDERAAQAPAAGVVGELSSGRVEFSFGNAEVLADDPSKIGSDGNAEGPPSIGMRELIEHAESRAFVSSPYLIPGTSEMASIAQARHAGVSVQILTNSLQSTDEPLVYAGFAKHAAALASLGVDVREVRAEATDADAGHASLASRLGSSLSRLHAKLVVVDGRWSSIGSFNLDRRSALWNTEMVVHVDCVALAHQLEGWAQANVAGLATGSRRARSDASQSVQEAARGELATPTDARWWQRAAVALVREDLL